MKTQTVRNHSGKLYPSDGDVSLGEPLSAAARLPELRGYRLNLFNDSNAFSIYLHKDEQNLDMGVHSHTKQKLTSSADLSAIHPTAPRISVTNLSVSPNLSLHFRAALINLTLASSLSGGSTTY